VYIEAMAAGCVTIGSRDEGIADVIRDGENGFLVTAGSVEETRNRLLSVLQAPEKWEKMRNQAKIRAREMTWERNARETARIYEQVLAGYRPCSV
jgi:glycosyltransferase involved in cell wall biosynthesis